MAIKYDKLQHTHYSVNNQAKNIMVAALNAEITKELDNELLAAIRKAAIE